MANSKGVVIYKKKGHMVPESVIELYSKQYDTVFGSAVVKDGELGIVRTRGTVDPAEFMKSQKHLEDKEAMFYFGKVDGAVTDESLQPFPLLEADDEVILAGFIEGEMPAVPANYLHTPEFQAFDNLYITFDKIFADCKEDLEKVFQVVDGPASRQDIGNVFLQKRGTIALLGVTDQVLHIFRNSNHESYDWGIISNPMPKASTASVPAVGGMSYSEKLAAKKAAASGAAPASTDTRVPASAGVVETEIIGPPPSTLTNKEKKKWWEKSLGSIPSNWRDARVKVKKGTQEIISDNAGPPASNVTYTHEKVGPTPAPASPAPVQETLPILTSKTVSDLQAYIKTLGPDSREIVDPETLHAIALKHATLANRIGIQEQDADKWGLDVLIRIGQIDPKALAILCMNRLVRARENEKTILTLKGELGEAMLEMDKMTSAPASEPQPPAPAADTSKMTYAEKLAAKKAAAAEKAA